MDDEIEWVNPPDAIETGTRHGPSGFEEAESAFGRAYSSIEVDVERLDEQGDTVGVIAEVLFHARKSGIQVRQRMGMLFTIREGRVARMEWSNDPDGLLSAVINGENGERGDG
jgi:ketosteroid isomerase-like protein